MKPREAVHQGMADAARSPVPTSGPRPSAAEVEAMMRLMQKYKVTEMRAGDILLVRPSTDDGKKKEPEPEEPDDFEKLKSKDPAAQDAALRLGNLGPIGAQ